MKKILIVGASFLQLPAIKRAKEKGYWIAVADCNPHAVGIEYADEYCNVSTIDSIRLLEVAKVIQPDGIMTMATDMPIRAIAYVTSQLGLIGHSPEVAYAATDKIEMITRFKEHRVASPWFFSADTYDELVHKLNYYELPAILKPADSSGSRGVTLVRQYTSLEEAFKYSKKFSLSGSVIVEQYIEGDEVSVELFVINGEPIVLAVTDKITTNEPYFVEVAHSQPSVFTGNTLKQIHMLAINATRALGITQGPVHAEMRITATGPVMIELGARMGGDCITSHLVPLSTGIDMVGATIDLSCNQSVSLVTQFSKSSAIVFLFPEKKGTIINIEGISEVQQHSHVREVCVNIEFPLNFRGLQNSNDRLGYIICQADKQNEALLACQNASERIFFEFSGEVTKNENH